MDVLAHPTIMVLRRPSVRFALRTPWDGASDNAISICVGRDFVGLDGTASPREAYSYRGVDS